MPTSPPFPTFRGFPSPRVGVGFIRTFRKPCEEEPIKLPATPEWPIPNSSWPQSAEANVARFFYDLKGSAEFPFRGGVFQWARFRENGTGLAERERIFSQSLHEHENTLTLATLKIFGNQLGQPHFHFNANEMGFVVSGCGQAGLTLPSSSLTFPLSIGDVVFFPAGSQHFIQSFCQEPLLLMLAYSTGSQVPPNACPGIASPRPQPPAPALSRAGPGLATASPTETNARGATGTGAETCKGRFGLQGWKGLGSSPAPFDFV
ncbi:LOW QUALITY PROTEIN: uncharacterized protein ACIQIH_000005 [Cyanocitta cristata]